MPAPWWDQAPDLVAGAFDSRRAGGVVQAYRFGLGYLELDSDDEALTRRFAQLYSEERIDAAASKPAIRVRCSVRYIASPFVAAIRFEDPDDLDAVAFCAAISPERAYVERASAAAGWRAVALPGGSGAPVVAMNGHDAVADRAQPWQALIANVALNRVLRLQDDMLFFHAASACVAGRGVMLVGPKGSGKTTLALALAARGHGFLGDEIAAVRIEDRRLHPFRRAVSIRQGPAAAAVRRRLAEVSLDLETFPDGSPRLLAPVSRLFPNQALAGATLSRVFFLGGFAERVVDRPFVFAREHFPLLAPLGGCQWSRSGGLRALRLSRLMHQVRSHELFVGPPDETVERIESLCRESKQ